MEPLTKGRHALEGRCVELPSGETAHIVSVQHSYEDGATIRLLTGKQSGQLRQADTFRLLAYPLVDWSVSHQQPDGSWQPAAALPYPKPLSRGERIAAGVAFAFLVVMAVFGWFVVFGGQL